MQRNRAAGMAIGTDDGLMNKVVAVLMTLLLWAWSGSFALSTADAVVIGHPAGWPHDRSDLEPDPAVVHGRLPSGFRYVMMKNTNPRDRVVMHLVVQAGSLHESDEQLGLAHFLEHMMFNGSTHFPPGELVKYFQRIGMQFGADANASTGFTETVYDIVLPNGSEESIKDALTVFRDYAEGALLLESEIDRERGVILAEKQTRDSAAWRTYVETLNFQMAGTLLPSRLPIGDAAVIQDSSRDRFVDFYNTWYRPERMILVVVGDVDLSTVERLTEETFGGMESRGPDRPDPSIGELARDAVSVFYHREDAIGNTTVSIETLTGIDPVSDSVAYQQRVLEEQVANRMLQNRLDRLVAEPGSPMTSASVGSGTFMQVFQYSGIEADCEPDNWARALSGIDQVLRQALSHGFQPEELARVRKEYQAELDQAVVEAPTRESRRLAREILGSLRRQTVFRSPSQEQAFFTPRLQALTVEEVNERLRDVWSPDHRMVIATGNLAVPDGETSPEQQIMAVYEKSRATAVSPPDTLPEVAFPYLSDPQVTGAVAAADTDEDLGIERLRFVNGLHLLLKPTTFSKGEIQFVLSLGDGRASEPAGLPGISDLAASVANESGLGRLQNRDLERALAGTQTRLEFGVAEDHYFFRGRSVAGEEKLLCQLLYAHLVDPGFREEALAISLERLRQEIQTMDRSVNGTMSLYGDRFLAGGDSRFGQTNYALVSQITLDNIKRWLGSVLSGAPLELSVVGDFDADALKHWVALYLGSLPTREMPSETDYRRPLFPVGQRLDVTVDSEIDKALFVAAFPTDDVWDIQRTRRLNVLGDVVSERVREVIREKLGAAYSPYAYNDPSRAYAGYGKFMAVVPVDPMKLDVVDDAVSRIAEELTREGVDSEAFDRAVEPTLTSIKDLLQQNRYWLYTVLRGASRHPEQLEWSRTIQSDYATITPEELSALAATYLDPERKAVIVAHPGR
ncbi:MAG: insulinase family protein [Desulfobacterales bacterium]